MNNIRYWLARIRIRWAYRNGLPIHKIKVMK